MWVPVVKRLIIKPEKATVSILKEFNGKDLITRHMSRQFVMSLVTLNGEEVNVKDEKSDRGYYVLEGQLQVKAGDLYGELSPGDAVFAPARMKHMFSGKGKLLVIFTPMGEAESGDQKEAVDEAEKSSEQTFESRFMNVAREAVREGRS